MSIALMNHPQQSLREGAVLRLPAAPQLRWLRVSHGRLWLTHSATSADDLPVDCWLESGDSVELPAGQDAVLEAWPNARFELLVAVPAVPSAVNASLALKPSAALRHWVQAWQKSPVSSLST